MREILDHRPDDEPDDDEPQDGHKLCLHCAVQWRLGDLVHRAPPDLLVLALMAVAAETAHDAGLSGADFMRQAARALVYLDARREASDAAPRH